MTFTVSSVISVSRKMPLDCNELAEFLGKAKIITDVTSNITMQPKKEYGCRLVQSVNSKREIEKIWNIMQSTYKFECAHLRVEGKFDGCILDYLAPTNCEILKKEKNIPEHTEKSGCKIPFIL